MPREQKTRSKASQKSKEHIVATQTRENTPTTVEVTTNDTQVIDNTTTINATDATISAQEPEQTATEQSTTSSKQVVWPGLQPSWQSWPTSKPGPRSTPPIPGTRPINAFRPEQFKEMGNNQQIGESATQSPLHSLLVEHTSDSSSLDQAVTQNAPGKGKQRL